MVVHLSKAALDFLESHVVSIAIDEGQRPIICRIASVRQEWANACFFLIVHRVQIPHFDKLCVYVCVEGKRVSIFSMMNVC